jgi:hypothetical protein
MANANREHWESEAKKVARQVNFAWWLETFSAPLLIAALLGAAALLLARREFPHADMRLLGAATAGGIVVLALACWAWAARRFENTEQSMVRIEAAMHLRNALSAATAGVAPWPAPLPKTRAGLGWQWPRLLVPPVGALALLAAGLFLPMSAKVDPTTGPPEQPQAWKQLSSELNYLAKEDVVDEKYIEETRKRLDELKAQKEDQWFSHSSLEATDELKKSHRSEVGRVEKDLGRAEKALGNLQKNTDGLTPAEKNRLMDDFDQALQGLQNGALKPSPKLLEQMKGLNMNDLAKLDPEQLAQLRDNMKKAQQAMKDAKGGAGDDWSDELLAGEGEGKDGNGGDGNDGEGEDGQGQGGVDRGPGHAPGVLGKEKDKVDTGELTGLSAKDLSHSTPGDLLELQDGQHDVETAPSRIAEGGGTEATGKGGDRVWRDALDPAEQRTLKRYFK